MLKCILTPNPFILSVFLKFLDLLILHVLQEPRLQCLLSGHWLDDILFLFPALGLDLVRLTLDLILFVFLLHQNML